MGKCWETNREKFLATLLIYDPLLRQSLFIWNFQTFILYKKSHSTAEVPSWTSIVTKRQKPRKGFKKTSKFLKYIFSVLQQCYSWLELNEYNLGVAVFAAVLLLIGVVWVNWRQISDIPEFFPLPIQEEVVFSVDWSCLGKGRHRKKTFKFGHCPKMCVCGVTLSRIFWTPFFY